MQLINPSYSSCINKDCGEPPTIAYNITALSPKGARYTIQVLSCRADRQFALEFIAREYPRLDVFTQENPRWLRENQLREAKQRKEGTPPPFRGKER